MGTGNAQDLEDGELQPVDAVMLKAQRGVILGCGSYDRSGPPLASPRGNCI